MSADAASRGSLPQEPATAGSVPHTLASVSATPLPDPRPRPADGAPVEYVHTLGAGLFYFVNEYTGKVNFGDGVPADATHQMLLGKDSPQVATRLEQTATTTRWSVASGGRMGGVLGEDSIELSAGATNCTTDCQARNRIQGSVPVPPDPTDPTPIG